MISNRAAAKQKNYFISVGIDSVKVSRGKGEMWRYNGKNNTNSLVIYNGEKLLPFTKYYWGVRIVDDKNTKSDLVISSFETGMMQQKNWTGSWITDHNDTSVKPAPYFRKTYPVQKKVKKAVAYITAAGLYELYINGEKIGNHRLDPMYTKFDKRNLYVTYDVTNKFKQETIALGVLLGNGWYNHQSTAVWNFDKAGWRNRPRFLLNIRITYEDGTTTILYTDESWKTSLSPIIFNSIYTAEHYDARKEQLGWNTPEFNDEDWKNSLVVNAPSNNIVAQALKPIRNIEEIKPVSLRKISDKKYIYDLGRNISGVTQLRVKGSKGTVLRLTHSEQLNDSGEIDLSNIDLHYRPTDDLDPFQTDIYTLNGNRIETFMPKFNYKGFQYVEVISNKPIELTKESLVGQFMHSGVIPVGKIESSNEIINKIWEATNASYVSNLFGYPTDCPQREKNGWTGDAHINIETALYNFDGITIYEKWLADHRDEQKENGVLPSIIPTWGWGYDWGNGPDWTSTIAIIPWEIYQFYGDTRALEVNYPNIKRYVDHITKMSPYGITDWGLGDWVPVKDKTPKELTSSIYYFVDATILAKTAKLLGKQDDYLHYSQLADKIKRAINNKYLNKETAIYGSGFQTELSAPLYWGIVPEGLKSKVADNLANKVLQDNKHLNVGLLGTKSILNALSENGYADLAYEIASQETFPSWGWWIKNGATTLYENWDIKSKRDISKNHIMFGEIGAWLFKGIGGIFPDPTAPGFKNVILKPHFVKGLEYFTASHIGPYGKIESNWTRQNEKNIDYYIIIPPNSTATVSLNAKFIKLKEKLIKRSNRGGFSIHLTSGKHHLSITEF
ncbi:family 78 glycoside hydrolase catalytic domain [Mariniflexile litorale]|uniref:alpha-L-rhamnosidase n=1 Tax=Mariniflexile litorale TaxID=3045158 RepID=A0AAU7EI73_9FLAO|nr:family 78 glycoside hydrolase catalytic domain [Mariniflexile sp. KMM 9835]MDQ8211938.1 family 78 glycoside hydrolase catalytic domain [Mariniflexile sp. KMM 9835]